MKHKYRYSNYAHFCVNEASSTLPLIIQCQLISGIFFIKIKYNKPKITSLKATHYYESITIILMKVIFRIDSKYPPYT